MATTEEQPCRLCRQKIQMISSTSTWRSFCPQLGLDRRTLSKRLMSFLLAHHQKVPCTNWFVADNEADLMQHEALMKECQWERSCSREPFGMRGIRVQR